MKRRDFIKTGAFATALGCTAGTGLLMSCSGKEEEISPAEDLMREHGVLLRVLIIYEYFRERLMTGNDYQPDILNSSAMIIRNFVENYHEKLEEDYVFPRLLKANKNPGLVQTLFVQHKKGRDLTDQIIAFSKLLNADDQQKASAADALVNFNRMYIAHAAREDTAIFPLIRQVVSSHEYDSLGEDFEKKENELFGKEGFESVVGQVAEIEKQIDLYDLNGFT